MPSLPPAIAGLSVTDLVGLPKLSELLGVGGIWTKDESQRLGLNSFSLGVRLPLSLPAKTAGILGEDAPFAYLASRGEGKVEISFRQRDGWEPRRGVAWAATLLGFASIIYS